MKKYLNFALIFAAYGLLCGVFFREFTKFNNFTGRTMLGMAHAHVLALGTGLFLLVALFVKVLNIQPSKKTKMADIIYVSGLILTSVMMIVRGIPEVLNVEVSNGVSGMISGFAGIGHIAVAAGLVRYILLFKNNAGEDGSVSR